MKRPRAFTRWGACLILAVCFLFVWVASAAAASTYTEQTPAPGSVTPVAKPLISVKVTDPAGIWMSGAQIKIDGLLRTPKLKWGPGNSYVVLSYQQTTALKNGPHTAYASVFTGAGRTSTTWNFTVNTAPTLGPLSPADGSTTNSQQPAISAGVTPNGSAVASYAMTVDGSPVVATYDATAKTISYDPPTPLANDVDHAVTLEVTDVDGNTSRVTWRFGVQIYAQMTDTTGCTGCHVGFPQAHPMTNCDGCHEPDGPFSAYWNMDPENRVEHSTSFIENEDCTYCHSTVYPNVPMHYVNTATAHYNGSDMSGCACHVRDLTIEHNRYTTTTGDPITCLTCHLSEDPVVQAAMREGKRACADCHVDAASGSHDELHAVDRTDSCVACHEGGSLTVVHLGNGLTCNTCHASSDPDVLDAIAVGARDCSACHAEQGLDYHAGFSATHTYEAMDASCQGAQCHSSSIVDTHASFVGDGSRYPQYADACALCHLNSDPERIPEGATAECSSCHPGEYHPVAAHTSGGGCVTGGCHDANLMITHATPGCVACHGAGKTPSLVCSNCHVGDQHPGADHISSVQCEACHPTSNLMTIHGDNCALCHAEPVASMGAWNQTCEQSGCHSAPLHPDQVYDHEWQWMESEFPNENCWDCHEYGWDCTSCHGHIYDFVAPTTTSDVKPFYFGNAVIKLSAYDPPSADNVPPGGWGVKATYYQVDGGPLQTGTTIVVPGPAVGSKTHTIEFWSVDNRCNTENPHKKASFVVGQPETTPPITTSDAQPNYVGDAHISLFAVDNPGGSGVASTYYRVDGGTVRTGTSITVAAGAWNTTTTHTIEFWSTDNADNEETPHNSASFAVSAPPDTTPPSTTCNAVAGATYTGNQTFALTPTDPGGSGVAGTWYRLDTGEWTAGTSVPVAAPAAGSATHTISWYSKDNADNTEATKSRTITVEAEGAGATATTSLALSDVVWLDANEGATGPWGTYKIYANDVLIGTKNASSDPTWNCPQVNMVSGGHIDIVVDVGFTNYSWMFDEYRPVTYTVTLPTGTTRLEAATWTGFPNFQSGTDWYDPYDDMYTGVWIGNGTIGNIVYRVSSDTDVTPPSGSISINSGASYTNSTAATLALNAADNVGGSGISQMRFSNDGVTWSAWEAYATTKSWTLTAGNGTKTVRVQYRDVAGNVSSSYSDSIVLDATAPVTTNTAVNGQTYFGDQVFTLAASDTGGSGVAGTWYKLDSGVWTTGTSVSVTAPTSGTQSHTVYWYARDNAGNQEVTKSATFTMSAPGTGATATTSLNINDYTWFDANDGATLPWANYKIYVNDVLIGTKIASSDPNWNCPQVNTPAGGHIDIVVDCGFNDFDFVWDDNAPATYTVTLPAGTTRVEAATWTGFPNYGWGTDWWDEYDDYYTGVWVPSTTITNITYFSVSAVDQTAPTGSITVNSGASYTNTAGATLSLSASDDAGGSGISQMRFSNDGTTWSAWEAYATTKSWTLTGGNGTKTVRVQYRDVAGNVSATYSDSIVLDGTAPVTTSNVVSGNTYTGAQVFSLSPTDSGGSGLAGTWYRLDSGTWTSGTSVSVPAPSSGTVSHTIYWYSRDNATNQEVTRSVTFSVSAVTSTSTLAFVWHPYLWAEAHLRVENASGVAIIDTWVSGSGTDLDLYVTVPSGQLYYMECEYYYDEEYDDEGGPYGIWTNNTSINPDGILSPGETVIWNY